MAEKDAGRATGAGLRFAFQQCALQRLGQEGLATLEVAVEAAVREADALHEGADTDRLQPAVRT
jgi:hypothetical protein